MAITRNPIRIMRDAAISVKGNARTCVFLEPLFAIPHNMYVGYMTLYMLELGLTKSQVGMITSLGLAVHIIFAFISAYLTDKFGRRYTTLIFDTIGWIGAQFIWLLASNIYFFIVAAIVNAFFRVVMTSWNCLMVEDSEPSVRVHIFNFMQIAGILAGFFAPLGALLVNQLTLVPAMRVMFIGGIIFMSVLFILRHFFTTETVTGKQKMAEMKNIKLHDYLKAYFLTLKRMVKNRLLIIALLLRSLNQIQLTIRNTFLAVLVTERWGFPAEAMGMFHTFNAVVMLLVLLFITPILSQFTRRWPISIGISFHVLSTAVLILAPPGQNYPLLIIAAILMALGTSITTPRIDALVANTISNEDRSSISAIMAVIILAISTPFGYIGGVLAGIDTRLPFLLTFVLFLLCLVLLGVAARGDRRREGME